jgi:hypothetical protein
MRLSLSTVPLALLLAILPAAAQPGAASREEKPYTELVRRAVAAYYPQLTRGGARGTAYVWFVGDGRGRIVGHHYSSVPPRSPRLRDALREQFPAVDPDRDARAVPDAAFPNAGNSLHPAGELGPDSIWVYWAERPYPLAGVPQQLGEYAFGRAASQQLAPAAVRQLAADAVRGDVVWYAYSDQQPLLAAGLYTALRPGEQQPDSVVAAVRAAVRERYPAGSLTCSLGSSLPNRSGHLVMTVSVRYQPPP